MVKGKQVLVAPYRLQLDYNYWDYRMYLCVGQSSPSPVLNCSLAETR